jgi:hypothetical protein
MLAAATAADQLKQACVWQMATEIYMLSYNDIKQQLLSLIAPEQQLEQVWASYKELKAAWDSEDPGRSTSVTASWQSLPFSAQLLWRIPCIPTCRTASMLQAGGSCAIKST